MRKANPLIARHKHTKGKHIRLYPNNTDRPVLASWHSGHYIACCCKIVPLKLTVNHSKLKAEPVHCTNSAFQGVKNFEWIVKFMKNPEQHF